MAVDGNFTLLYGLAQTSHMVSDRDALFEIYVAHRNTIVPMLEAGLLSGSWDDIRSLSASPTVGSIEALIRTRQPFFNALLL
jgi:hypothetical protein